jgi:hypothetical protein
MGLHGLLQGYLCPVLINVRTGQKSELFRCRCWKQSSALCTWEQDVQFKRGNTWRTLRADNNIQWRGLVFLELHSSINLAFIFRISTPILCPTLISAPYRSKYWKPCVTKEDVAEVIYIFTAFSISSLYSTWTPIQNLGRNNIYLSICLSVCLSVCLYIYLSV